MDKAHVIDGKPLKVYIAGPMSGLPEYNFPAFHAAAAAWRAKGCEVVNPAELDQGDTGEPWHYYLRRDLPLLCGCDGMALLPGWRKSKGARLEASVAEALGLVLFDAMTMAPLPRETILDEAKRLVCGDRGQSYGPPAKDYARTAKIWSGVLLDKLTSDITAREAMLCMIGVKMSREAHLHKRDNLTDIAGYAECISQSED